MRSLRPIQSVRPTKAYHSLIRSTSLSRVNGRGDLINPARAIRRRLMAKYRLSGGRAWKRLKRWLLATSPSQLS